MGCVQLGRFSERSLFLGDSGGLGLCRRRKDVVMFCFLSSYHCPLGLPMSPLRCLGKRVISSAEFTSIGVPDGFRWPREQMQQLCQQTAGVMGRLFEKTAPVSSQKLEGKLAAEVFDGKKVIKPLLALLSLMALSNGWQVRLTVERSRASGIKTVTLCTMLVFLPAV